MTGYACIWEFRVEVNRQLDFQLHYGPGGTWAMLFRRSPGYIGTLLLRDRSDPLRYVTIDRWTTEEEYRAFRTQFAREYAELDEQCGSLTTRESCLGEFTVPVA